MPNTTSNMDPTQISKKLERAVFSRNVIAGIAVALFVSNVLLSIAVICKNQKTVLVPASFKKDIVISNSEVSTSYVEEMTNFYLTMILEVTPENIDYRFSQVLKYTAPETYHAISKFLKEEATKYKKYNLSTNFVLEEITVNVDELSVKASGKLSSKFSAEGSAQKQVSYEIKYKDVRGRLLIKEFTLL